MIIFLLVCCFSKLFVRNHFKVKRKYYGILLYGMVFFFLVNNMSISFSLLYLRSQNRGMAFNCHSMAYCRFSGHVFVHCQSRAQDNGDQTSLQSERSADCVQLCTCTSIWLDGIRGERASWLSYNIEDDARVISV